MTAHATGLTRLAVRLEDDLAPELEVLRRRGWGNPLIAWAEDAFDAGSAHLVARAAGRPVGMVRITRGPASALLAWSGGRAPLVTDASTAELTRAVVAPELRRLGLYRLLMVEAALRLEILGIATATAAVEFGVPARSFLAAMGFVPVGAPVLLDDSPRCHTLVQCLRVQVEPALRRAWTDLKQRSVDRLAGSGYLVDSDVPLSSAMSPPLARNADRIGIAR